MNERCEQVRDLAAGYVLGALDVEDEAMVRRHLVEHPGAHPEIDELGGVVPYLAESVPLVEPPVALKGRILSAAAADLERAAPAAAPRVAATATPAAPTPFPSAAEREQRAERKRRSPLTWVAGLAAVLVIAALGAWNVTLQRDLGSARDYERGLSAVLDVAAQPGSQTAILAAQGGTSASGIAAVGQDGQVAIVLRDLAPTTGNEVYEAWVIGSDETPVPIGDVRVGDSGTATIVVDRSVASAGVTLAVSREPDPNSTAPRGPIVSAGQATAAG